MNVNSVHLHDLIDCQGATKQLPVEIIDYQYYHLVNYNQHISDPIDKTFLAEMLNKYSFPIRRWGYS